jgi:hypothetical protein
VMNANSICTRSSVLIQTERQSSSPFIEVGTRFSVRANKCKSPIESHCSQEVSNLIRADTSFRPAPSRSAEVRGRAPRRRVNQRVLTRNILAALRAAR